MMDSLLLNSSNNNQPGTSELSALEILHRNYGKNVNHVIGIEDGKAHYMMGNVEVDVELLRAATPQCPPDESVCAVCGGKANGMHFKAISCAADNAFFRRTVAENRKYICRRNGDCEIGNGTRCSCRACRLKKCLIAGMDPKAVQPHRDSIGRKPKSERQSPSPKPSMSIPSILSIQPKEEILQSSPLRIIPGKSFNETLLELASQKAEKTKSMQKPSPADCRMISSESPYQSDTATTDGPLSNEPSTSYPNSVQREPFFTSTEETPENDGLIEQGLRAYARLAERRRLVYGPRSVEKLLDGTEPEYRLWKGTNHYRLHDSYAVPIANMVEFVKAFPGFCSLSISDQMALFRHFTINFIIFEKYYLTYRKGGLHSKRIYRQDYTYVQLEESDVDETVIDEAKRGLIKGYSHFIPPEDLGNGDANLVDEEMLSKLTTPYIHYALEMLVRPMEELGMTDVEFMGSSLAFLFDPNLPKLSSAGRDQIKQIRNQLYMDWFSFYESLGDSHEFAAIRMGNTLLISPVVDDFVRHYQEHFHLLRLFGVAEYDKLLDEFFIP